MLEVEHLSFAYGRRAVLDDVSFRVDPGETLALAGANGAGKSTLLKVLAGLHAPEPGTVKADGADVMRDHARFRRVMGYLPEGAVADDDLSVKTYLRFRAKLKGEKRQRLRHRVLEAMELCGLLDHAERRIGALSYGLKKRVALAEAVVLRPRFIFLDDPLASLDVGARGAVGRIVAAVSSFACVVVAGHELEEMQAFASRFLVLRRGRVLEAPDAASAREVLA